MTNIEYPVPCLFCQKPLYGPVDFCPFCGQKLKESPKEAEPQAEQIKTDDIAKPGPAIKDLNLNFDEQKKIVTGTVSTQSIDGFSIEKAEWWIGNDPGAGNGEALEAMDGFSDKSIVKFSISIDTSEYQEGDCRINVRSQDGRGEWGETEAWNFTVKKQVQVEEETQEALEPEYKKITLLPTIPWKWIVLILVSLIIIGLLYYRSKGPGPKVPDDITTTTTTSIVKECESERALALEALHQGVQLSAIINTIAKQENLVKAAKKLADISNQYVPQLADAESKLHKSFGNKDKTLMLYREKLIQLSRFKQEQLSCAIDVIKKEGLSSREKLVIELLARHLDLLNNDGRADQDILLSDFTQHFNNFND